MEKKSNSFRRLGRLFKSRSTETEKVNEVPSQDVGQTGVESVGSGNGTTSKEQTSPMPTPSEVKKKPFGSWRAKRKNLSNVSISPPSSPGLNDRSFDASDGDQDLRPHSMFVTSVEDKEATRDKDSNTSFQEELEKSKASPTELPKKDVTKKPVLGKFEKFFNSTKKKQGKGVTESPTSPTEKTVTTYKSEKEVVRERKKVIVVASTSKVQTHARNTAQVEPASDQFTQHISKDSALPVGQRELDTTNGNPALKDQNTLGQELEQTGTERPVVHTNAFLNRNERRDQSSTPKIDSQNSTVTELEQASRKSTAAQTDTLSEATPKNLTPKIIRQNSNEKSVRNFIQSPGRRSSTDGETTKPTSVRRLSQETNTAKEESPKITPKKTSRFSGKVTDSKYKISDKQKTGGSAEKLNASKVLFQGTLQGDSQEQGSPPAEQNLSPDSAGGSDILRRQASGSDLSPVVSPTEGDVFTESPQDQPKNYSANGQSNNAKVLTFDIYLSKTGTNSPTTTPRSSSAETMDRNSPGGRKSNKKRRSFRSQSSQNEEKKTESFVFHDDVFDEGSFTGVQEKSAISDSNIKPVAQSPESNGTVSANQELKAGANPKHSPKGESDKDKQQHPASSPLKKKNVTAWAPSSPTVRKAQSRDSVFRNQTVAAAAKGSDFNQPALVSTTKDAYVEKACVLGSFTGSGGEELNDISGDISPTAAGVPSQDKKTRQESIHGTKTEPDSPKKSHYTDPVKLSGNDSNKSTVTSKLNIPPKPKNVELPFKPKAVDTVDEHTIEVPIAKGNIASKVSLFESKKTSQKQVDFYATKTISQQKKYVERAKLNFGKQVKGNVVKDSSSTVKSASESHFGSSKKTENCHGVVKAESKDKSANRKVDCTRSEDTSQAQGNPMPMEDKRNGLEKLPGTIKPPQESILPSAENEHKGQPTESANGDVSLTQSISQSNDLKHTHKAEEPLLHASQDSDDTLVKNTAELKNSGASSPDSGHIEMGNKHNSLKEQPIDDAIAEETQDSTLPPDHVDSAVKDVLPSHTEELQINGSKEAIDREGPPENHKTVISKETIKPEDIAYDNVHEDMPIEAVQRATCIDSKPEDNCVVPDDLPHNDIINGDNQEQTQQSQSEDFQCKEQIINDPTLMQDEVENKPSHLVNEEECLPPASTVVLDAVAKPNQKESITEETQNSVICSNETSNGYEEVHLVAEAVSMQGEDSHLQDSTSSQKDSTLSDEIHNLEDNNLSASSDKTEYDQTIQGSIGRPQDQINSSSPSQDQNSSSITSKDLDNCSVAPQNQNTVAMQNVADETVSCSEVTKEVESQHTSNKKEATTPLIKPEDDHSQNTIDSPANIIDPSTCELGTSVAVDQITENLVYVEGAHMNTLSNVDETGDRSYSPTLNNNDGDGVNGHVFVAARPRVLQNGFIDDSHTTTLTNGSSQRAENSPNFLDVQKSAESSFNTSVGGEDSVLDSSSDMEIFAETIRKLDSPITLPQKRKTPRAPKSPTAYCGLPPIREDYLEKILDNDSFLFGLGKKDRARDLAPMALFKMQSKENAEKLRPKRASAEQSMILKSLRSPKEPLSVPQETCDKENADVTDVAVKRSRIESIYSGLKSPFATRKENVFSPTVTTVSTITTSFDTPRKEFTPLGKTYDLKTTDCVKTAHTAVREDLAVASSDFSQSTPAEHSLSTPVYSMDNHLETKDRANNDLAISLPGVNGQPEQNHCETDGKEALPLLESTSDIDKLSTDFKDIFYFKGQDQGSSVPNPHSEVLSLQGAEKINPRPGKLVILTEAESGGAVFEVFADIPDCSSWELSPTIFIKSIRGCWILYEHPNFEGRTIPLEEGDIEVTNPWGEEQGEETSRIPVVIGSLRHVVKDYRVCQIDLFTDPGGLGIMTSYVDDTEELQVYGRLQRTCSVKVHCGVWLIYEESGFQGIPFILEPGEYPDLSFWNTQEAYIGSLRPLKMGSRKVEIANEPKIIIFEKPMFEGRQMELDKETMTFKNFEIPEGSEEEKGLPFTTVGSMRVISGLWVGYERPGFEGHQYLLEEGDYEQWSNWGGYNGLLQSLRPILSDFSSPHMIMYSEKDFDEKGANINVLGIIANMEETGFGLKTQSINVLSGVWVAYECPDFTGEQYILEKGIYSNFSAWGAKNGKISSVQPILMETLESPVGHFKVEVFSQPDFQGQNQIFEGDVNDIEDSFKIMSCKVSSGRWALYDKADLSGNLWVIEEGIFPDLCAMGCPHDATIKSLKMINYEFSEPNVVLFGKENFKGRRVKISKDSTDLQAMGYSPNLLSLEVLGGIWVFYEYANFRGRQLLISPSKIAQWQKFSSWNRIGSLRPLRQKRLYFKLRNKDSGMMMSTNGNLEDVKLLRIQVTEENGAEDQIWVYQKGVIRCRIAEDCSLAGAGSLITAGSKLGFLPDEPGTSPVLWNISPEGRIHSRSKPNLVLDVKGGNQYDKEHIVLTPVTEGKLSQMWEVCIL